MKNKKHPLKLKERNRNYKYLFLIITVLLLGIFGLIKYSWDRKLELDNLRWEQTKEKIQIETQQRLQEKTLKTQLADDRIQKCIDKVKADYAKQYSNNLDLLEKINQEKCHINGEWNQQCTLGYARAWKNDNDKLKQQEREDMARCQELYSE